jgi:hypothetical protein
MRCFRTAVMIPVAIVTWIGPSSAAFAQTSPVSLEEGLTTQYKQGTVLAIQTNGVVGVNAACQVRPGSIFKDGQLHAPGIVQKSLVGAAKCDTRAIPVGSQVYLAVAPSFSLKNNRIDFIFLQCDVANCSSGVETSYKAQVAFEFPKGYLATAGLGAVQDAIKHVFSVDATANDTGSSQTPDAVSQPAVSGSPSPLSPAYVSAQNSADRLQLNADASFSLQEGGQSFSGTYSVTGTTLKLQIVQLQKNVDIVIRGNQLIVNGDEAWVPLAAETGAAPPTGIASASVTQPDAQPSDPDAMAARMLSELPSPERIGQAVRVFLADLKQKGALPQEAFAVATPTVMPSGFDMGQGGSQPSVTAATGIFELRNATYECGSADSGPKSKSKKGSVLYTLSAKIQKQPSRQWILQEIAVSGRNCSPTWKVQIPVP